MKDGPAIALIWGTNLAMGQRDGVTTGRVIVRVSQQRQASVRVGGVEKQLLVVLLEWQQMLEAPLALVCEPLEYLAFERFIQPRARRFQSIEELETSRVELFG